MQEMEWHLFAMVFLFGIAYALKEDGHVRVDILYFRRDQRRPGWPDPTLADQVGDPGILIVAPQWFGF